MNELDRPMGLGWARPSCTGRADGPRGTEFSAPRIEIENGELVIRQKEARQ